MSHPQCVGMAGEEVLWHGFDDQRAGWCWVKRPCRPLRLGQSPSRLSAAAIGTIALQLVCRCDWDRSRPRLPAAAIGTIALPLFCRCDWDNRPPAAGRCDWDRSRP